MVCSCERGTESTDSIQCEKKRSGIAEELVLASNKALRSMQLVGWLVGWFVSQSVGRSVSLSKVHGVLKVRSNACKKLKLEKWLQVSAIMNLQTISLRLHDY